VNQEIGLLRTEPTGTRASTISKPIASRDATTTFLRVISLEVLPTTLQFISLTIKRVERGREGGRERGRVREERKIERLRERNLGH